MAHYQFDAYQALENLRNRYADFLIDTFAIPPGALHEMLASHWSAGGDDPFRLFAPVIVQPSFPFRPGNTLPELLSPSTRERDPQRPLHPKTVQLLQQAGITYRLYQHQVQAIRDASEGKTVVLSAGTGSGKTEAFLIPIIDTLHWAHEFGDDDLSKPGVRAIVVYPLNALVNNQVDRIQKLLKGQSTLSFAYYTSRLRDSFGSARSYYERRHVPLPPPCQIIDRKTLRGVSRQDGRLPGPPHILVTNFSMLEYMLIRPLDRPFFLPERLYHNGKPRLRALVLDEAHVYAGAQTAEIHMLLRRAAERFGTRLEDLQGYATSATLSQGAGEASATDSLTRFVSGMFSKQHEQVSCVIGGRYLPDEVGTPRAVQVSLAVPDDLPRGALVPDSLRTLEYDAEGSAKALVQDEALADAAMRSCILVGLAGPKELEGLPEEIRKSPALLLHHVFSTHPLMGPFRRWFFEAEQKRLPTLDEVAGRLYREGEPSHNRRRAADAILRLGSLARASHDRHPFLPSRMHAFVRAPQGVWVDPVRGAGVPEEWPWGKLYSVPPQPGAEGEEARRLELLLCERCGLPHMLAWKTTDDWGEPVLHATELPGSVPTALTHIDGEDPKVRATWGELQAVQVPVHRIEGEQNPRIDCVRCAEANTRLRALRLSARSALGAIIDGIYPFLGEYPPVGDNVFRPGDGRRLLTFSDSRQEAARVACAVEDTHDLAVNRRLLWDLARHSEEPVGIGTVVEDLAGSPELKQRAAAAGLSDDLLQDLARICVYQEFGRRPARANSLETLGLVEVCYPKLPRRPTEIDWLSDPEWEDLLRIILDDARRRGATVKPVLSAEAAEFQLAELLPPTLDRVLTWSTGQDVEDDSSEVPDLAPMIPAERPEMGRLLQFAKRLCQAADRNDAERLLELAWLALLSAAKQTPPVRWLKLFQDQQIHGLRLSLDRLELRVHAQPPFVEPLTRTYHFRSLRNVSPDRGASAALRPLSPMDLAAWESRHAIRRIRNDALLGLHSVEHTAQLDVDALEKQEGKFRRGETNLLASSTTMEMGIDLGGLTLVLMTNVPPGPANYWQRAGRAGRRADGSSMALTLALARPHDQKVFLDTRAFLASPVTPPKVRLDTPPLLLRHVNAWLLANFLDGAIVPGQGGNPMTAFGRVEEFLVKPVRELNHRLAGGTYDDTLPMGAAFTAALRRLTSADPQNEPLRRLVKGTALSGWTTPELARACADAFEVTAARAMEDLRVIRTQREAEEAKGEGAWDRAYLGSLRHQEKALRAETLISYLARNDFLPRFGFPVSVVRLDTDWEPKSHRDAGPELSSDREPPVPDLRMERSLDLALAEYAPGSEVIAGKRVHRVAGVVRNWMSEDQAAVTMRFFMQCLHCGHTEGRDASPIACPVCGHPTVAEDDFVSQEKAAAKQRAAAHGQVAPADDEAGPESSSPVRFYLEPSSFSVKLCRPPRRLTTREPEHLPPARVVLAASPRTVTTPIVPGALQVSYAPQSRLFVRSEGILPHPKADHGYGFAICQRCGFAEPERSWKGRPPTALVGHRRLRGNAECNGTPWRNAILGTSGTVDAFRVRLTGEFDPGLEGKDLDAFLLTLAVCLQQCAAARLQVDQRTLRATVATWSEPGAGAGEPQFGREAVLYEDSCSGLLDRLLDDPHGLFSDFISLLDKSADADFVRFDTQFLVTAGQLRIDLVRKHFADTARRALLQSPKFLEEVGANLLQDSAWQAASHAIEHEQEVLLFGTRISEDAFAKGGLLRAVQARTLRQAGSVRLLVTELPPLDPKTPDQVALSAKLARLVEDGLELRVAAEQEIAALRSTPWRLVSHRSGVAQALGGVSLERSGRAAAPTAPDFGSDWLRGSIAICPQPAKAAEIRSGLERNWANARAVAASELAPNPVSGMHFVLLREGDTCQKSTRVVEMLSEQLGRPLPSLGRVRRLLYVDKYVRSQPVTMWQLARLLEGFEYDQCAVGKVFSLDADEDIHSDLTVDAILALKSCPSRLSRQEAKQFDDYCARAADSKGLEFEIDVKGRDKKERRMRHPRKLLVEFAPGGSLQTLKVAFEHGLGWAEPVSGPGPWPQRDFRAQESFALVIENHDLKLERDTKGRSEWEQAFLK